MEPGKINHPPLFFVLFSVLPEKKKMRAGNLTNTFAALLLILKSMFTLIVVFMMHFSGGFRFSYQQNLDRINSLSSINFTEAGRLTHTWYVFP